MKIYLLCLLTFFSATVCGQPSAGRWADICGKCEPDLCEVPPVDCLGSGLKLDACECCYVCARTEGERCSALAGGEYVMHRGGKRPDVTGVCDDELDCRLRDDVPRNEADQAICYCQQNEPVCGNNGRNYPNLCNLNKERYKNRNSGLALASRGLCPTPPVIVSVPEDVRDYSKANVVLTCEASGNPVPKIEWHVTKPGSETTRLPSDDQHTAVQSRGGPRLYEVTSWLQLREIVPEDEGVYSCVALNSWGQTTASAHVHILDDSYSNGEQEHNANYVK